MTPQELAALEFASGSMGTKVQAACDFVNHGIYMAGILMRHAGTQVVPRHGA